MVDRREFGNDVGLKHRGCLTELESWRMEPYRDRNGAWGRVESNGSTASQFQSRYGLLSLFLL